MPNTSIVFDPELDERQLGRETDKVNEELQEVGQGVPVSFEGDMSGVQDGLEMPGGGGGAAAGGGGGGGAAAEGAAAMAGKIPKPVAGVAAAAALPVALSGSVGLGMLGAMQESSARLQTSASILGVAKDNFFREPAKVLDEAIVRPLAKDILKLSTTFSDLFQEGNIGGAFEALTTGRDPRQTNNLTRGAGIFGTLGGIAAGGFAGAKAGGAAGAALGSVVPGVGTAAVGTGGAITGALVGAITAAPIGGRVASAISSGLQSVNYSTIPDRIASGLSGIGQDIRSGASAFAQDIRAIDPQDIFRGGVQLGKWMWDGGINMGRWMWNGSVNLGKWLWSGSIGLGQWMWSGAINWGQWMFEGAINWGEWMFEGSVDIVNYVTGQIDIGNFVEGFIGGGEQPGSGNARGGVVNTSGVAQVHSGEMIGDERQLVEELSNAINGSGSTGGGSMDTTALENKLDRLHRDLNQLKSAFDVTLETDDETLARSTNNGRRNRLSDTDPTV